MSVDLYYWNKWGMAKAEPISRERSGRYVCREDYDALKVAAARVIEAWLKYSYAQPTIQALNDLARNLEMPLNPPPSEDTSK